MHHVSLSSSGCCSLQLDLLTWWIYDWTGFIRMRIKGDDVCLSKYCSLLFILMHLSVDVIITIYDHVTGPTCPKASLAKPFLLFSRTRNCTW